MRHQEVIDETARIRAWGEERDWCGYDPYDGLNSPLAPLLTLGSPLGRRVLTQVVKRSPINLRPMLGIRPTPDAKAIGLVASAYARLARADGDESAAHEARRRLGWLVAHPSPGTDLAWGYHFPVQTRVFGYARETPNTIATSFAAQALLDGCELLGDAQWRAPAAAAARYLAGRMTSGGERPYFRYLERETALVHNANLLACAVLARSARVLGFAELAEPVPAAAGTTLAAQRADGSWPYAEGSHGWVDNFHTGYVLESLAECVPLLPDARDALVAGVEYWQRELFLADGTPKYLPDSVYPLDAHCYAQAIETWLAVEPWFPDALEAAERGARLLVERMLDPRGYVRFQRHRFWTNGVPFVRWTTAPAFRALARLRLRLAEGAAHDTSAAFA